MKQTEYALYKGDELVMIGTVDELAKHEGVEEDTIRFYSYPTYLKRVKEGSNRKVVVKLDD